MTPHVSSGRPIRSVLHKIGQNVAGYKKPRGEPQQPVSKDEKRGLSLLPFLKPGGDRCGIRSQREDQHDGLHAEHLHIAEWIQ